MGYLDIEDRGRIKIQDNIMTITNVHDERDPGMYQCRATNALKTRYSSAQLRVLGKFLLSRHHVFYLVFCSV